PLPLPPWFPTGRRLPDLPQYDVVHPTRVDARGRFLSNLLSHHVRRVQRREAAGRSADADPVFYRLWHNGRSLRFNLTLNAGLLAPGFLTERRYGGLEGAQIGAAAPSSRCHFLGEVWDEEAVKGRAAISACDGLTGLFRLSGEEFFIQPLEESSLQSSAPQAHAIYKRHAAPPSGPHVLQPLAGKQTLNGTCGNKNSHHSLADIERQRERWERRRLRKRRRIRQRSVSKEKWVETLVVADPKMVEYHGSHSVENYILAVMNIVAGLFGDASIGNAINVVVVRLILLEKDEDDLKITHHADNSLLSFCKWQKKLNTKGDDHPLHHDVAVLLTRKDICAAVNVPCETLGLSHVAGMCQAHRSCSISEDTGLPVAFTVAHELGHNFGIQHDGNGNDCEPVGKRPFVMSPQLLYGTSLPKWSRCSRDYITRFLDRGWGWCLDDAPVKNKQSGHWVLPGVLYSAVHQCRLQYGSRSRLCDDVDNVCSTLWCTVGTTCHSKLDGAVDGTSCGEDKWCFGGECVAVGHQPAIVHGGWGSWSEWSTCSRTCGAGVQRAHRDCDNPVPKHRGKYCLGERRRYKVCSIPACGQEEPTFRHVQCSHFNALPYKGKFYQWEAVFNRAGPCELHCRPLNENFSEKMRDARHRRTPCYEGNKSRDMCINGICKKVGCDYVVESSAVEDRMRRLRGSADSVFLFSGYVDIGLIPEGAREIRIQEVAEAGNFLALRSDNPNKYFLNGGWTIQWNGDYKAAGAVFTYERTGHLENLTSPGPTTEPLWIQLLFQEPNPGVRYEYTINRNTSDNNNLTASSFFWKFGSWAECSVTCGAGVQRQIVHCVERMMGIVEEHWCDPSTRPNDNQTSCRRDPCPAVWWVGEWHKCSASCGSSGQTRRTVLCVQAVSVDEQKARPSSECEHVPKPTSLSTCNTHIVCPADWTAGNWSKVSLEQRYERSISKFSPRFQGNISLFGCVFSSEQCSLTCGGGVRRRNISCSRNTGIDCDPQKKPPAVSACSIQDCPPEEDQFGPEWSGSGWSSNEINSIPEMKAAPRHSSTRAQPTPGSAADTAGDFHYHNNIEGIDRSPESSVRVDDFYYDYNFINFHEDLSDDFESDGNGAEGVFGTPQDAEPTAPNATVGTPEARNLDPTEDSGDEDSVGLEDLLSEDYLLPVSTTDSPPVRHSQKEKNGRHGFPAKDVNEAEVEKGLGLTADSLPDNVDMSATNPGYHTTLSGVPTSPTSAPVGNDHVYVYSYYKGSTLSPGNQERFQSVQMEESASEIPRTPSQSVVSTSGFRLGGLEPDHSAFRTHATGGYSWNTHSNPTSASLSASEDSRPTFPTFLQTSGNQQASVISTSPGTGTKPPTGLEEATRTPPANLLPAAGKYDPTESPVTEGGGAELPPQAPWFDVTAPDETLTPITERRPGGNKLPPGTTAVPEQVTTEAPHRGPPTTTHPAVFGPFLLPTSVQSTASAQATFPGYWITGNWSACSTSCGLGAVWRTLSCSSGSDSDCDPAKRPAPAQRCYLRPCASWRVQEWSKCSRNCEGGSKSREVTCVDLRDERPLRPFHCRAVSSRPQAHLPCNLQPCLDWIRFLLGTDEACGAEKNVPLLHKCSASCGGGVQHRLIKCVNTKAEAEEVEASQCDPELQPASTQNCNVQKCVRTPAGAVCTRDRLTSRFCQTLLWLGHCQLPNIRAQCCRTCSQTL
ncbi:unnamed protein product, partial [Tetraodon nigroviridis]